MKKYSVNVHYDAIISVEVLADSEEEALRLAINQAAEMPSDSMFIPNGPENPCVTDVEDMRMSLQEAIEKAEDIVKEKQGVDFDTQTITCGKIWDGCDYKSHSVNTDYAEWSDRYDEIDLYCGEEYEHELLSELSDTDKYNVCMAIIEEYAV